MTEALDAIRKQLGRCREINADLLAALERIRELMTGSANPARKHAYDLAAAAIAKAKGAE